MPSATPVAKKISSAGRLSHPQASSSAAAGPVPPRASASGASRRHEVSAGAAITTAQVATAARQPSQTAMGGSTSAEITPPTVSPICLMPIAMPRSRVGKRSTMALPSTGFTTLHPVPATTKQARNSQNIGAAAASERPAAASARPPRNVGRTPSRSARCPAGREKKSPGR